MSLCDVQGRLYMMSANFVVFFVVIPCWCPIYPVYHVLTLCPYMITMKKTYMDFYKEGPGTSIYEVRGRSSRRSARVFFLCPGLASTFSLVRAMSVDHSYRFLKMLTILEIFTILYTCDKVGKILYDVRKFCCFFLLLSYAGEIAP